MDISVSGRHVDWTGASAPDMAIFGSDMKPSLSTRGLVGMYLEILGNWS